MSTIQPSHLLLHLGKHVLLLGLPVAVCCAQSPTQRYDSVFTSTQGGERFSGQVLIAQEGTIIYQKQHGVANEQAKLPVTKESVFNLASLTKQFTAVGIVLLHDRKRLSYEDKITKFFPELTTLSAVSLRNLLNNTSGIPSLATSGEPNDKGLIDNLFKPGTRPSNADLISALAAARLMPTFSAGSQYEYSNTSYVLLASVIEKVSGQTYAEFITKNIFIPLRMDRSFVSNHTPYENKQLAIGYMRDSLQRRLAPEQVNGFEPLQRTSGLVGGMGIFSTASDLYKWITRFKSLLSEESYQQLVAAPTFPSARRYDRYGFGFELGYEKDFSAILFHSGRWPGYSSYLEYAPVSGKTIILLQNDQNSGAGALLEPLKNLLYNVQPHQFIKLDSAQLGRLTGSYRVGNGSTRTILFQDGKLLVAMNPQVRLELKPVSPTRFVVDGFMPEVQYEFILQAGKVEKYINTQPETGTRYEAFKVN